MKFTFRLIPAFALGAVLMTPVEASQQNVDDLRRRVETIEQRMFQQQLSQPMSPQTQAVQQLEARLRQLEMEIASERISQTAATVTSRRADPDKKTIESRLDELEKKRAADAVTIAALTKRLEALEKPPVKRK